MIIGITGTFGAGKGTIVEYLKQKGFKHYSVSDYLTQEIKKRGLPVNRDSMIIVANQLREINSPYYFVEELYKKAKQSESNSIIESIRTQGEAEKIKQLGGILLSINAKPELRYSRAKKRASEKDNITFEKFQEQEKQEMSSTDPTKQNLSKCIEIADFQLTNNEDIESLHKQIEKILFQIKNKQSEKLKQTPKEIIQNKEKRMSWDDYFMKIASVVAERSTCLRHNIAAVIVKNKRIISTGYNGAVKGGKDCLELGCKKDQMNVASGIGASEVCRAVHAEQNAIIQAAIHGINTEGATLYCTTIPCRMCAKEIVNSGIKEVVTYSDYPGAFDSIEFLQENGVKFRKINRPSHLIKFKD